MPHAEPSEPAPVARAPGRIIFLNGASSSGKSSLARALQDALDEPFLHVASDHLVAAGSLPRRRDNSGPFDWWQEMRPQFFAGFHRCLPALAGAGNDLIVDHIIEFPSWRRDLARLLADLDVYLVGAHCAAEEIDRRERARGDRRIGEGRTHLTIDRISFLRAIRSGSGHDRRDQRRAGCLNLGGMAPPHTKPSAMNLNSNMTAIAGHRARYVPDRGARQTVARGHSGSTANTREPHNEGMALASTTFASKGS